MTTKTGLRLIYKMILRYTAVILFIAVISSSAILLCGRLVEQKEAALAIAMLEEEARIREQLEKERQERIRADREKDIRIPNCGDMNLFLYTGECDFEYTNPESNSCYLVVSITRKDTNETIYISNAISPGNTISGIIFSPAFRTFGVAEVMIKVDAYAVYEMSLLGSMVFDSNIHIH